MKTDPLLERLAEAERDARPASAWSEVLEGRLEASDLAREGHARGDDPNELQALAAACEPLSADERRTWARRLRAATRSSEADDSEHEAPPPAVSPTGRSVISIGWIPATVAALAAAAALVLWLRPTPDTTPTAVGPELPPFRLVVRNDTVHPMRGVTEPPLDAPARYRADSTIHWMILPETSVSTPIELGFIIEDTAGGSCLRRAEVTTASNDGILEVRGTLGDRLGLGPGRWTLTPVAAAEGTLPPDDGACEPSRGLPCPCPPSLDDTTRMPRADVVPSSEWTALAPYEIEVLPP